MHRGAKESLDICQVPGSIKKRFKVDSYKTVN